MSTQRFREAGTAAREPRAFPAWRLGLFVLFGVVMFRSVLPPDAVLFSTDDNIGSLAHAKSLLPRGFFAAWDDALLAGVPTQINIGWTNLLLWLLPVRFFVDWIHGVDLVLGSFFFGLFLRERGRSLPSAVLGALVAYWLGSTFTLTFAGHMQKFGIVLFAGLYLWLVERAAVRGDARYALLAGGAMGAMFLEQADVALFFSLFLGPYAIYAVLRERGPGWKPVARVVLPLALAAGPLAMHPLSIGYVLNVGQATTPESDDPRSKWAFATQWSWPPDETIDFVAPGYTGWRSGEPAGPYWGRMGRSAGWETTRQGFQNFRLESMYIGAAPIGLALWSLVVLAARGCRARGERGDRLFWAAVTLVSFLLALGKFFPLYRLLYLLPGFSSIRNPVKLLQVFQFGLAFLASAGLQDLQAVRADPASGVRADRLRVGFAALAGLCGVFVLWGLGFASATGSAVSRFAREGWGGYGEVIARNVMVGLLHAALMWAALVGALWLTQYARWGAGAAGRRRVAGAVVALVMADALFLSRHYIQALDIKPIVDNPLAAFLQGARGGQRVALTDPGGPNNFLMTYVFPYHHVPTLNVTQMPRMPARYREFLDTVGRDPLRLWQLSAVGLVLGPAELWQQIQQTPAQKDLFSLVFAYNLTQTAKGGIAVVPASAEQPGRFCVLRFARALPRFALAGHWRTVGDEAALNTLAAADADPLAEVLVAEDTEAPAPGGRGTGAAGTAAVKEYRPGFARVQTVTEKPALLRFSEKHSPGWRASVDGKPATLLRCDYLFQGVHLDPGLHEVVFEYRPPRFTLLAEGLGLALCAGALVGLARSGRAPRREEPTP
jgi:hypothetical protein